MANPAHHYQCVDFLTNLPNDLMEDIMMRVDLPTVGRAHCVARFWKAIWSNIGFCDRFCKLRVLNGPSSLLFISQQNMYTSYFPQRMKFVGANAVDDTADICCKSNLLSVHQWFVQKTGQQRMIAGPFCPSFVNHYWNATFDFIESMGIYCIIALGQLPNGRMHAKYLSWMPYQSLNGVVFESWQLINSLCPRVIMPSGLFVGDTVYWCINKVIHWPIDQISRRELLITFSCSSQTFNIIQAPNDEHWKTYPYGFHNNTKLLNLQGKLCVVDEEFICLTGLFQMWEWTNDGDRNLRYHWRNLHSMMLHFTGPTLPVPLRGPFSGH
ncbi:OLC1v1024542C1 [Oldenlandia corymbosa var. corymbosa]|uniref:OLC1v1024542C1 n=1 Tax=Oldenlandia corymbosa var. corymbosa TaxID=529605 RepID=A0AAV1C2L4_OLDCO|nr:OLC1v1024542C1 [Oldenlandia corymbosa var. corymbosa]